MIILTPSAVALRMECTTREAFRLMRRFGAIDCRDAAGKPSLRITEERFLECLSNAMASTNAAEAILPITRIVNLTRKVLPIPLNR